MENSSALTFSSSSESEDEPARIGSISCGTFVGIVNQWTAIQKVSVVVKKQMKYLMLNLKVTYYIYIISNAWNSKHWSNCASPIKPLSSERWQLLFYAKIISTPKQCFVKIKQVSFAKQKIRNCIVNFFDCKHLVLSTIFFLETSEYFWNW